MKFWQIAGSGVIAMAVTITGLTLKNMKDNSPVNKMSKDLTNFHCTNKLTKATDTGIYLDQKNNSVFSPGVEMHFGYWKLLDYNSFEIPTVYGKQILDISGKQGDLTLQNRMYSCKQVKNPTRDILTVDHLKIPGNIEHLGITTLYTQVLSDLEKYDYLKNGKSFNSFYGPAPLKLEGAYTESYRDLVLTASTNTQLVSNFAYEGVAQKSQLVAQKMCNDQLVGVLGGLSKEEYDSIQPSIAVGIASVCPKRLPWFVETVPAKKNN
jgi:hypothetical protein